jgi:hypothetical protein
VVNDWEPEDVPPWPPKRRMKKWVRCMLMHSEQRAILIHKLPMVMDLEHHSKAAIHYTELYWKYLHEAEGK